MEEIAGPSRFAPGRLARWPAAAGLFAAVTAFNLLGIYLDHFGRLDPAGVALTVLVLPMAQAAALLPWAGLWALAGRMLRQQTHFWVHVSIPLLAYLVYSLLGVLFGLGLFALDMDGALVTISAVIFWAINVWMIGAQLHWVSRRSFRWIWIAAFVTVTTICGLFAGLGFLLMKTFGAQPEMPVSLSPHFFRLVRPKTVDAHLAPLPGLKERVDAQAAELAPDLQ